MEMNTETAILISIIIQLDAKKEARYQMANKHNSIVPETKMVPAILNRLYFVPYTCRQQNCARQPIEIVNNVKNKRSPVAPDLLKI